MDPIEGLNPGDLYIVAADGSLDPTDPFGCYSGTDTDTSNLNYTPYGSHTLDTGVPSGVGGGHGR